MSALDKRARGAVRRGAAFMSAYACCSSCAQPTEVPATEISPGDLVLCAECAPPHGRPRRRKVCPCGRRLTALLAAARSDAEGQDAGADGLLTPDERHVLLALFLAPGMPLSFDPAPRSVAEALRAQTGLSVATVRRALRVLEQAELVEVERRHAPLPHRYTLRALQRLGRRDGRT